MDSRNKNPVFLAAKFAKGNVAKKLRNQMLKQAEVQRKVARQNRLNTRRNIPAAGLDETTNSSMLSVNSPAEKGATDEAKGKKTSGIKMLSARPIRLYQTFDKSYQKA